MQVKYSKCTQLLLWQSGKQRVLPPHRIVTDPHAPLRTGLVTFTTSGSSLSKVFCETRPFQPLTSVYEAVYDSLGEAGRDFHLNPYLRGFSILYGVYAIVCYHLSFVCTLGIIPLCSCHNLKIFVRPFKVSVVLESFDILLCRFDQLINGQPHIHSGTALQAICSRPIMIFVLYRLYWAIAMCEPP